MCAHAVKARPRAQTAVLGDSQRLNTVWMLFLKGKNLLKGSAMLLSWQHRASPFLGLGHGSNRKYALRLSRVNTICAVKINLH